jgi:hypothetical protein
VELVPGGGKGTIRYPELDCEGSLTFARTEGATYVFRETIKSNRKDCGPGGIVSLRRKQDQLSFRWRNRPEYKRIRVVGTLDPETRPG